MTANRLFSKALRRLHVTLKDLENRYGYMVLNEESFDNIFIFFVDRLPDFHPQGNIKNRDYSIEIPVPQMNSYKQDHDQELLLRITAEVRAVLEQSPMNIQNKNEVLHRFSEWESSIRKKTLRVVETPPTD